MLEPAQNTKHLPFLHIPFRQHLFVLAQADDGASNGTALWLSGQVLAAYVASLPPPKNSRVIELGSGIGFTALVLASLGYHVLATDAHPSVLALLTQNIQRNAQDLPGSVQVRELDWCVPPDQWDWSDPNSITRPCAYNVLRCPPPTFDLIITADTLYVPHLTPHLLRTLDHIQALTPVSDHQSTDSTNRTRRPTTLIALERRDPTLIESALALIPGSLTRIPHKKLSKALQGMGWSWDASDWEGVEVWKVKWPSSQ